MDSNIITIGVISDTHGLLRLQAVEALQGSDHISHAGDVGDREILIHLREIAPLTVVRGNVDVEPWTSALPGTAALRSSGITIAIIHNIAEFKLTKNDAPDAVVFGHSHKPLNEMRDGILFFNPGSAGPRRFKLPVSVGRLTAENGRISGEIVILQV